jgi:hypothetical protein
VNDAKKRVRRGFPGGFSVRGCFVSFVHQSPVRSDRYIRLDEVTLNTHDARRLAKWLTKVCDWMEAPR